MKKQALDISRTHLTWLLSMPQALYMALFPRMVNYRTVGQEKTGILMGKSLQGAIKEGPFPSGVIGETKRGTYRVGRLG